MKNSYLILLILFLVLNLQGQISESWNLDISSYPHNTSNYTTKNLAIEIAEFSTKNKVVLSQNGILAKINPKGKIIWQKEISSCARQKVIIDINDNIILSCGSTITKLDTNGKEIWSKNFSSIFKKKYLTFDAIISDNNKIYLAGHFFHSKYICQISINTDGTLLWKTKFKQNVNFEHSFLAPKQIILHDDKIHVLSYQYSKSNSFLYSSNLLGKKRKEHLINYKIKKLKLKHNSIFALGHLNNLKDKLIFTKLNKNLKIIEKSEFKLPRNFDYKKAIRSWSSPAPSKEEFDKKYITAYDVNDFEFVDTETILVIGSSYGKPWIIKLDLNHNNIIWNWDEKDTRYFNFNNDFSFHHYSLHSIHRIGNKFLISGISHEKDHQENRSIIDINLFLREIELIK